MDPNAILALLTSHQYFLLAFTLLTLAIGIVVRLLKSDGPLPWNLPSKYRPWLAVALGITAGITDAIATGTPWKVALIGGVMAAFTAMSGHALLVESARGGREFGESKPAFQVRTLEKIDDAIDSAAEVAKAPDTTKSEK